MYHFWSTRIKVCLVMEQFYRVSCHINPLFNYCYAHFDGDMRYGETYDYKTDHRFFHSPLHAHLFQIIYALYRKLLRNFRKIIKYFTRQISWVSFISGKQKMTNATTEQICHNKSRRKKQPLFLMLYTRFWTQAHHKYTHTLAQRHIYFCLLDKWKFCRHWMTDISIHMTTTDY